MINIIEEVYEFIYKSRLVQGKSLFSSDIDTPVGKFYKDVSGVRLGNLIVDVVHHTLTMTDHGFDIASVFSFYDADQYLKGEHRNALIRATITTVSKSILVKEKIRYNN